MPELQIVTDESQPSCVHHYPREVVARVKAALRRRTWDRAAQDDPAERAAVSVGNVTLDPASRDVLVAGALVRLRQREFDLLEAFLRHPNVVLDRERLLRLVWGVGYKLVPARDAA